MAVKGRLRRKLRRKAPAVRRLSDGGANAARLEAKASGLIVGGAHAPAEKAADRMAARVLARGAGAGGNTAPPARLATLHREARTAPSIAPGSRSAVAPKAQADAVKGLGAGRRLFDAVYVTVVILTTVGMKDPTLNLTQAERVWAVVLMLAGISTALYAAGNLVAFIIEGDLRRILGRRQLLKQIEKLQPQAA